MFWRREKTGPTNSFVAFNQRNHFLQSEQTNKKKQWIVSIFNLPRAWDYKDIISCPTGDEPIWSTVTWLTPLRNRCRLDTTGNFAAIIENKQYKKAWNALINFFFWEKKTMKLIKANAFISNSMPINGYDRLSYRVSWLVTQSSIVRFGKDVAWRSKRTSAVPTSIPSISEEKDRRVDGPDHIISVRILSAGKQRKRKVPPAHFILAFSVCHILHHWTRTIFRGLILWGNNEKWNVCRGEAW